MTIRGLNHLTLAVSNLDRSLAFYRDVLGCKVSAVWATGAYLEAGTLWLRLSLDAEAVTAVRSDYTHFAFDVDPDAFDAMAAHISARAKVWKENRSEGQSLYILDPDEHKLEMHTGSLATWLAHYRQHPPTGVVLSAQPGCA